MLYKTRLLPMPSETAMQSTPTLHVFPRKVPWLLVLWTKAYQALLKNTGCQLQYVRSIRKRPFFEGQISLSYTSRDKASSQKLFCPLHLKGSTSSLGQHFCHTQTHIELTGKRAQSCLPAAWRTLIFRHQWIWVEKQTDEQTGLLHIAPRNQNKTMPLNSLALTSCSCNSRHRIPTV